MHILLSWNLHQKIFNINSESGPKILKALKSPLADVQILHLNKETKESQFGSDGRPRVPWVCRFSLQPKEPWWVISLINISCQTPK